MRRARRSRAAIALGPALAVALALVLAAPAGAAEAGRERLPRSGGARPSPARPGRPAPPWKPEGLAVRAGLDVEPLAIVGADVHPVVGRVVPRATLLLRNGRIEAILPEGARIPEGFRVLAAHGLQAWPGWVAIGGDGLGLADDAWAGGPEAILARGVGESFDPWSDQVELAASGGITTILVWRSALQPKGPLAGRAAVMKTSVREPRGALVTELGGVLASPALLAPEGRRAARLAVEAARGGPPVQDPRADLWKALARGDAPLLATFDSAADILAVAELCRELELRLLLVTPAEAWPVAAILAEQDAAVVQNVRHSWGKPREDRRGNLPGGWRFDAVTRLAAAGVPVAIAPDSATIAPWGVAGRDLLDLPIEAAFAVRAGLSERAAIEAITIGPARLLGLEDRVGSLEPGKDADVILLDGDPLDYRTLVRTTIVNGRVAHDASKSRFWRGVAERRDRALRDGSDRP